MSRTSPPFRAQSSASRASQPSRASGAGSATAQPVPVSRRPPLERMLDHRLQSVSTFVSSTDTLSPASGLGKTRDGLSTQEWSAEMPQAILFPANKPSSRADAAILDRWITNALAAYAQRPPSGQEEEELSRAVEELVPILSIGLHEVVRQVTQHCLERGLVLEKIWRTYVELFERALGATRASLRRHKEKTAKVEAELARARGELTDLKIKHPEQIVKLSATLAGKFAQRQDELEEQLRLVRSENQQLQDHLKEQRDSVQSWFPLFPRYKDTQYKAMLQTAGPMAPTTTTPEARIAADYKRIIAQMPPEGRRRVGFFVSSLLGLRGFSQATVDTAESLTDKKEHNAWKIEQLEARLKELQTKSGSVGSSPRSRKSAEVGAAPEGFGLPVASAPEDPLATPVLSASPESKPDDEEGFSDDDDSKNSKEAVGTDGKIPTGSEENPDGQKDEED